MGKFKRINVEISNVCNLKCSFCPAGDKDKRAMSPAEFTRVAAEIAPLTEEVVLHLLGEPLNHPQLDLILDACTAHALPVNIVTNGVLLTGPRLELLLRPIVRQVSFSLQSFEDNFHAQDPTLYLRRIKTFVERALSERPDLYMNLRFWDLEGIGATDTARNSTMREALAEAFAFTWDSVQVDLRRRKSRRLRGRLYLHFDSRFEWPRLSHPVRATRGYCHGLTGHVGVHADGTVVPCCLDQSGAMPLGNVLTTPLREILDGPRARDLREGFAAGELREPLCQRCSFITRFDGRSRARRFLHVPSPAES
jgi:MoaA/NifB/PqqE/SkfB family radical SAM enzyme